MTSLEELTNPIGKFCACGHPAYAAFSPFAGRYYGFKCACCFRLMWEEAAEHTARSLAALPTECEPAS